MRKDARAQAQRGKGKGKAPVAARDEAITMLMRATCKQIINFVDGGCLISSAFMEGTVLVQRLEQDRAQSFFSGLDRHVQWLH